MRNAHEVTFGGTGRDRGHALRSQPERLAELQAEGLILPMWRGQPLMGGFGEAARLGWLRADHAVLKDGRETLFLGLLDGKGVFAVDVSRWAPEEGAPVAEAFEALGTPHPAAPAGHAFGELRGHMADLSADEAEIAATARALLEWHRGNGFCANCGGVTTSGGAGWHRACEGCGRQHFPRTDPVVIMLVTRGNSVLLGRSPGWPEGMFSLLAGFIEPGETMEAAVAREVFEETAVHCGKVEYLASQPWPFPASLMLGCRAEASSDAIEVDPVELEEAIWLTREEFAEVFAGRHPKLRAPRRGSIARFILENWLADRLD